MLKSFLLLLSTLCCLAWSTYAAADDTVSTYRKLTVKPQFPGDMDLFIKQRLKYPDAAREQGIEGSVGILFMVDEQGMVTHVSCKRSSGSNALDQEAMRVVQSMPKWTPGYYKKRPVRVLFAVPVIFRLD